MPSRSRRGKGDSQPKASQPKASQPKGSQPKGSQPQRSQPQSSQEQGSRGRPSKLIEDLSHQPVSLILSPAPSSEPGNVAEIANVVALGSYNWVDHKTPTMIIPGAPPAWKEPQLPLQLNPGAGDQFVDQDTTRYPQNPLEPMIKAISVTQEMLGKDFKLADERIDVVADRNSLRKLLRFVRANGSDRDPRPAYVREFRVDVQLAPNNRTLVLIPHEGNGVDSSSFRRYGSNLKRATTIQPAPLVALNDTQENISQLQPTSYHRIIRYDLLGLRFLVRSEVDAVMSASDFHPDAAKPKGGLEDLVNTFAQTSISGSTVPLKPEPVALKRPATIINADGSKLRYVSHGELVPQSDIIDVRIVSGSGRGVPWSDVYPQLFLSQTPTTKLATQAKGRINTIETYNNESQALKETHDKMSPALHALTEIITQVRDVAKNPENQGKPLALYWSGFGDLKVFTLQRGGHSSEEMDLKLF